MTWIVFFFLNQTFSIINLMNCLRQSSFSRNYTNIVKKKTYENNNNNKTLNSFFK